MQIAARMFTWSGARSVEGMPPFSTMSQYHDCSGTTQTCPPTSSGAVRTPCALHCSLIALNFEIESCHQTTRLVRYIFQATKRAV